MSGLTSPGATAVRPRAADGRWYRDLRVVSVGLLLAAWLCGWGWYIGHEKPLDSWGYFERAVHLLFSADGLQMYRDSPELQFGPVTTVLAAPFVWLGPTAGKITAAVFMSLVGLGLVLWASGDDHVARWRPNARRFLLAGLFAMPVWADLVFRNAHFDDVLSILFACLSVAAIRRRKAVAAAVLIGLAIAAKPWALPFAVVLLALRRRDYGKAASALFVTVAVSWLPFFLAEPRTLEAMRFKLDIDESSLLGAFGGMAGEPMPGWVRPLQLVVALLIGYVLTTLRRHEAALLAIVAVRIMLDPATHNYYASGAVVLAVLADRALRFRGPWLTAFTALLLWLPNRIPALNGSPVTEAVERAVWGVVTILVVLVVAYRHRRVEKLQPRVRRTRRARVPGQRARPAATPHASLPR